MKLREQPSVLYSTAPANAPALLYHAAPIHYLPSIFADGALYPKAILAQRGIAPRPRAARRDRALGLANYVHLGLKLLSPLRLDKLSRDYPHAVLVFDGPAVLSIPGVAILAQNTKAWRSKAAYCLVTDRGEQEALLGRTLLGRLPGLEVLIPYGLSLRLLHEVMFFDLESRDIVEELRDKAGEPGCPMSVHPLVRARCAGPVLNYLQACVEARRALPPPAIPFD